jgi:hypothetical protein
VKKRKKRRRPGRPATGHDRVVTIRLPEKLIHDVKAWADVYRHEHELPMTASQAYRCLLLLGLEALRHRAIDPKDRTSFEGDSAPLLKFYRRAKITRWLEEGTGKKAKQRPPPAPRRRAGAQPMTTDQVQAAADRAVARSRAQKKQKD